MRSAGEHRGGRALDVEDRPAVAPVALGAAPLERHVGVERREGELGRLQAEDHAGRLLGDARPRAGRRRDGRARRHVARADVLLQGPADHVLDDLGVERRHAREDMRVVRAAGPGYRRAA